MNVLNWNGILLDSLTRVYILDVHDNTSLKIRGIFGGGDPEKHYSDNFHQILFLFFAKYRF